MPAGAYKNKLKNTVFDNFFCQTFVEKLHLGLNSEYCKMYNFSGYDLTEKINCSGQFELNKL